MNRTSSYPSSKKVVTSFGRRDLFGFYLVTFGESIQVPLKKLDFVLLFSLKTKITFSPLTEMVETLQVRTKTVLPPQKTYIEPENDGFQVRNLLFQGSPIFRFHVSFPCTPKKMVGNAPSSGISESPESPNFSTETFDALMAEVPSLSMCSLAGHTLLEPETGGL